ncbi:hypothetical protein [uncultured Chitinophaga sp.]|jgi:hypothetical protein|uniref:hypothetical protein n=1 Tax=uncultured Chitinophaga sp. TaxID=339340 RepID=UPI002601D918|nr:hypothetical protein [uncultured Chitinophaga sp.]
MALEKAEALLTPEEGIDNVYRLNTDEFDIFFFPAKDAMPAKIMVSMKVDDTKVPPTGSGDDDEGAMVAEFTGDLRGEEFVFFVSRVETKLLRPDSTGDTKELRIEFEVPGAALKVKQPAPQSLGSSAEK